ncbi:hypothetical protein RO1_32450 [Roseburia intestinalis XB6B4]|uniref:Uncharacterized protein n=1 Tax=Roseburia intestinalis XB6B4 TaxID=718255 RepID=D4L1S6_9FIRM|nr:hypothetical protein ROI_39560 [Roseburia intestinalis M50/1]CBL13566.1 hypothetical protein RO1_32450 [Roseburia intestinalis XB6B4]
MKNIISAFTTLFFICSVYLVQPHY